MHTLQSNIIVGEPFVIDWRQQGAPSLDYAIALMHGDPQRKPGHLWTVKGSAPVHMAMPYFRLCKTFFLLQCFTTVDMLKPMQQSLKQLQSSQQIILGDTLRKPLVLRECLQPLLHAIGQSAGTTMTLIQALVRYTTTPHSQLPIHSRVCACPLIRGPRAERRH